MRGEGLRHVEYYGRLRMRELGVMCGREFCRGVRGARGVALWCGWCGGLQKYQIFYFYIKYFTHKNIIYPYGVNKKSQKRFFGMVEMLILHNDIC